MEGDNKKAFMESREEDEDKNLKEKLYDKIPISLMALDIIINTLIAILGIMMAYFIGRKYL